VGDLAKEGMACRKLGAALQQLGRNKEAREYLESSLKIARKRIALDELQIIYEDLGHIYKASGEEENFAEMLKKGVAAKEYLGVGMQARRCGNLGQSLLKQGMTVAFSDTFYHWAGFVVIGARTRARQIPADLSWSMCSGLKGGCKDIVAQCLLDGTHRDTEDPDRDRVLASFLATQLSESESEKKEEIGVLLPDEIVRASIFAQRNALEYASEELRKDKQVMIAAVQHNKEALEYVRDKEVILAAVKHNWKALEYVIEELRRDKDVMFAAVHHVGNMRRNVLEIFESSFIEDLRADKEAVLYAVKKDGNVLKFASDDLRGDIDVVLAAVKHNGQALWYASKDVRGDKMVVLTALKKNGTVLEYASEGLRGDRDVVLAAVTKDGMALEFASEGLCEDERVGLAAILNTATALNFVTCDALRGNTELLTAIHAEHVHNNMAKQSRVVLRFSSLKVRGDKEKVLYMKEGPKGFSVIQLSP